jgi:hypothetical protein
MNECRKAPPNYTLVTVDGVTRTALVTVDGVKRPAREPPWDADDWAWFNTHTLRRLRLRPPLPGEPCLRDYPDAEERVEAARQCGFVVAILVMRQGLDRFARVQ